MVDSTKVNLPSLAPHSHGRYLTKFHVACGLKVGKSSKVKVVENAADAVRSGAGVANPTGMGGPDAPGRL